MIPPHTRRAFLSLGGSLLLLPYLCTSQPESNPVLTMGVIADLHHGLAPDALRRLNRFMRFVDQRKPDALLQLGDFNFGNAAADDCMRLWRQFTGPRYHVLGNHDMDFYSKAHMTDYWEMPAPYYSFDRAGFHFIVLDRNNLNTPEGFVPYDTANFYVDATLRGFADPEQLEWLRQDLAATSLPTVVFVHQGLGMEDVDGSWSASADPIEQILAAAKDEQDRPKVHVCFCGHHHVDRYRVKDGIHYVWLNSASYYWVGEDYGRMAFYKEPLFSFLTFYDDGIIAVKGNATTWAAPSPQALGYPGADKLNTLIASRRLS